MNNNEKEKMKYYKLLFIYSHNMSCSAIWLVPPTYIVSEYYLSAVLCYTLKAGNSKNWGPISKAGFKISF